MKKNILKTTLSIALICSGFEHGYGQSIRDLDFLIGTWQVEETLYPGTDKEYKEKGMRTCEYYLGDSFIKCEAETTVSKTGKNRMYVYLINYNKWGEYYQAINFSNDYPAYSHQQWYLDADKKEIRIVMPQNAKRDRFFRSKISFRDPDRMIWEGWQSRFDEIKDWFYVFRDVGERVK
ncbi:MAG: hypothetical protein HEP71_26500 [Roseivirga sp.]|nr:hypothetical protein [Roseivirga sp.]